MSEPSGSWDSLFDDLVERLVADTDPHWAHTGFQLVVRHGTTSYVDVAYGVGHTGQPFERDTLSALYCTAKPLIATAVLAAVDDNELSLDDRVGDVVENAPENWIAQRTISELLTHTAGLHTLDEITPRILPQSLRRDVVWGLQPPSPWRFGADGSYSPFAAWWLLGEVLEGLYDTPYFEQVQQRVLAHYGVDETGVIVKFDHDTFAEHSTRIAATFDFTRTPPVPLLAEVGERTATEWNPAYGSYGTACGLADFYTGVLGDVHGAGAALEETTAVLATTPRAATEDVKLGRRATFGLGFMCDLQDHHFSTSPSPRSFGHAGQGGTSWAMADAEHDVVIAAVFNGGVDEDTALRWRRATLVASVYKTLGVNVQQLRDTAG